MGENNNDKPTKETPPELLNNNSRKEKGFAHEKFLSIIAIIISLAAFWISYKSYVFSNEVRQYDLEDRVAIILKPPVNKSDAFVLKSSFLQVYWECIITNTGNRTVSIIAYQVDEKSNEGKMFYTGINGGLFDENKNTIQMPITLEPGESKFVLLDVSILLDEKILSIIHKEFPSKHRFSFHEIIIALAKQGVDFYGNKIRSQSNDSSFIVSPQEADDFKRYLEARFFTGKGYVYLSKFTYQASSAVCDQKNADLSGTLSVTP